MLSCVWTRSAVSGRPSGSRVSGGGLRKSPIPPACCLARQRQTHGERQTRQRQTRQTRQTRTEPGKKGECTARKRPPNGAPGASFRFRLPHRTCRLTHPVCGRPTVVRPLDSRGVPTKQLFHAMFHGGIVSPHALYATRWPDSGSMLLAPPSSWPSDLFVVSRKDEADDTPKSPSKHIAKSPLKRWFNVGVRGCSDLR